MIITLLGEKPVSWNKYYSGGHWSKRHKEAQRVHALMRAAIDPDSPPFRCPVDITVTVYFANRRRQLDADNIASKLYIDGLKGWVIADDDRRYVRGVRSVSEIDRDNPRLVIEVVPLPEG